MLKSIYIKNLAIIDVLELDFFAGMSALTGETGAGKSIIIDALNLTLGARADRSIARDPNDKVEVIVVIDTTQNKAAIDWLKEHDLYNGDECILRRIISTDGKSKAYINNSPCSASVLRSIGDIFVDVYGQHEHQSLMQSDKQRELLDYFAGNEDNVEELSSHYRLWQSLKNQLEITNKNQDNIHSRREFLEYQDQELEQLDIKDNEFDEINELHLKLNNAKELNTKGMKIYQALAGESDDTIYDALNNAIVTLSKLSTIDSELKIPLENLQDIQIQTKETAKLIRDNSEKSIANPEELQQLEERISAIENIARKHKVKPTDLCSVHALIKTELESLQGQYDDPESIRASIKQTEHDYRSLANKISLNRKKAAIELNENITASMQSLGMKGGRLHINVEAKKTNELSPNGLDNIQFLTSTNPGQSLRPLHKVASGGELSRLSLAIQIATANRLGISTLIFDEVDSGVGGATAEVVGRHMRQLGNNAQVFCVTHLPQVAAQAHHHYKVRKLEIKNSIIADVTHLRDTGRIKELARMLGGLEMTRNTKEHAKEMLLKVK